MYVDKETCDVKEFHRKFLLVIGDDGPRMISRDILEDRVDFLQEEMHEFGEAVIDGNLADIADALIDIVYVAKGTAIMMGLPWEDLWQDVQRANMAKVQDHSKCDDPHKAGMIKPENWIPPDGDGILVAHGYVKDET